MVDGGASPVGPDGEPAQETVREERLQQGWRRELSQQGPREELHQQSRSEELFQQGQREECFSRARVGNAPAVEGWTVGDRVQTMAGGGDFTSGADGC